MSNEGYNSKEWYALSQHGLEYLEFITSGNPNAFIRGVIKRPTQQLFTLAGVARAFDEPEESKGNYVASSSARAVLKGEILGMELAAEFLTIDALEAVVLRLNKLSSPLGMMPAWRRNEMVREKILEDGYEGWELACDVFGNKFDYWNAALTNVETDAPMIRFGFGLIVKHMEEARAEEIQKIASVEFSAGRLDDFLQSILEQDE